jgi:GNAT superfamily N-acetyltransferase
VIAVTTTYLEIGALNELKRKPAADARFEVREAIVPHWQVNRFLYLFVGERWGWTDKQTWADERWQAYVGSADLRTFIGFIDDSIAGYYELHKNRSDVEIAYFGLAPDFIGEGLGGALLSSAIENAFAWDATRVWVHTCTLDHPAALRNYLARGLRVYASSAERRASGPANAPQVKVL